MKILLSNDDGILAPGLAALHAGVRDLGDVTVVAPESVQSAAGHSITLRGPLTVQRVHVDGPRGFSGLSVDGRPADCVRLAVFNLLDERPDLVLSGINIGANVGINVFYSGTVAAAAEGAMLRIPAVAFSAEFRQGEMDFARVARCCRWVLDALLADGLTVGGLINVNVPDLTGGWPKGIRVVPQSTASQQDTYELESGDAGGGVYRLGDAFHFNEPHGADSDVNALGEGYITVTSLHVDMTDQKRLQGLVKKQWPVPPWQA